MNSLASSFYITCGPFLHWRRKGNQPVINNEIKVEKDFILMMGWFSSSVLFFKNDRGGTIDEWLNLRFIIYCLSSLSFPSLGRFHQAQEGKKDQRHLTVDPSTSSKEKGKVLRVLPSGRWVPRNQGWLNFWETNLVTVRKSLHRSCWTELTCQGILLP